MDAFAELLRRVSINGGIWIGGTFLIIGMLLLISNILGRFFHFVIPGSYELFELIMAIPVAFALVCAAFEKSHVVVDLVISRFPRRLATISEIVTTLLSFAIWGFIAYAAADLAYENGLRETSDILGMPYLPFRLAWTCCLFLFCIVYFINLYGAIKEFLNK